MQAIEVNGQLVAYRYRKGGGPCVVFINAAGTDQSLWDGVLDALPRGFDTLTYDLRGHGLSGASQGGSIDQMADDLIAHLNALGLGWVILCGVSLGGHIALSVARRRPDVLQGVILCSVAPVIGTGVTWDAQIEAVKTSGLSAIANEILDGWVTPNYQKAHPAGAKLLANMLRSCTDEGYAAACGALRDASAAHWAKAPEVPILCVAGGSDSIVPQSDVAQSCAELLAARLEILPGVGHLIPIEAPKRLAGLIEQMLQNSENRFDTGMKVRRRVLGDAHVDRAEAAKTTLDAAFQSLITESAWGTVWASPGISARERSMLTLALLAALGNFDEIPMHVRATERTGASPRDIEEAFQHVALYAGVPRANHALKLARQALSEMKEQQDD